MRLLFVSHSLPPADRPLENVGGMQRVAVELHDVLARHARVRFVPLVLRSAWSERGYRVPVFLARALAAIRRLAAGHEVDAILFTSMVTAALAVPLRGHLARRRIPTAALVYGQDVTLPIAPYQQLVPRVFAALDLVLPVSRATAEACSARGLPGAKQLVMPLGIDLDRFRPLQPRTAMRRELTRALGDPARPLPEGALLLCSVGRQVERKGFAWFVDEVMPVLPGDVHYWLAGDGPQREAIRAAMARRGLERRVRLLGRASDAQVELLYRGADLFVMPNVPVPGDMEGFGLVLLEAGACGLPAVASGLEGIMDVVTEGANGHLVQPRSPRAFGDVIARYHRDRAALEAASRRAASHVAATFGWRTVVERYVEVMRSLRVAARG